ncbi:insulinase family protein [Candidatus Daviesbacteria bacterium]|nr:insulinase family protein [Candidatus Daviesbacteria bacterium]
MLQTFTLKNGMKVATYCIPQMRSVYVSVAVKAGSIFDTEKTSGTAHFMEHILFEGTPSFPNIETLTDFIEKLSGSFGAYTGSQIIRLYMNAPAPHLEDILKIIGEVFFQPLFPQEAIEKGREVILEEIRERQNQDWYKKSQFFSRVRFRKGHPLLLDGGGLAEVVTKLNRKNLVSYWESFFFPKNTYLVLVGGFKNDHIKSIVSQAFKNYSPKKFSGFPKLTNNHLSVRTVDIREDNNLKSCSINLSFPSISDDYPLPVQLPQTLIRTILTGLHASRLWRLLVQRRGLVYNLNLYTAIYQHFAYSGISTESSTEHTEEVLRLITEELSAFIKNGPTSEEIDFAKNYRVNNALMQFDHPNSIAGWMENDLLWEDKIYTPEEYVKLIKKVTKKDIMEFMQKYWDFSKLNLVVQGPIENSKAHIKKFTEILSIL